MLDFLKTRKEIDCIEAFIKDEISKNAEQDLAVKK